MCAGDLDSDPHSFIALYPLSQLSRLHMGFMILRILLKKPLLPMIAEISLSSSFCFVLFFIVFCLFVCSFVLRWDLARSLLCRPGYTQTHRGQTHGLVCANQALGYILSQRCPFNAYFKESRVFLPVLERLLRR